MQNSRLPRAPRYPVNPGDPLPDPQLFSIENVCPERAAILRHGQRMTQTVDRVYSRGYLHRVGDLDGATIYAFYYFIGIYEPITYGIARLPGRTIDFDLDGHRIRPFVAVNN